jgi:hypothetical protein
MNSPSGFLSQSDPTPTPEDPMNRIFPPAMSITGVDSIKRLIKFIQAPYIPRNFDTATAPAARQKQQ